MNKDVAVEDIFNHWDLPRDGQTFFAKDNLESLALFLDMSSNATYVLLPAPYMDLLVKWEKETACIQLAPMTPENLEGGFIGTVNSVEIFSDVYADPKRSYVRGAPIIFGQWGGQFSRQLEYQRTPYYRAKYDRTSYFPVTGEQWDEKLFNIVHGRPEHILIPARLVPKFNEAMNSEVWEMRREQDIEKHFNGHLGWYNGIPVYTDSFMHRRMINPNDLIEIHYPWKMGQPKQDV